MVDLKITGSRSLNPVERDVVMRELRNDARGMRYMSVFVAATALFFGGAAYAAVGRGWWLMAIMLGVSSLAFGGLAWLMWGKRASAPSEPAVLSGEGLCKTHHSGKHSNLRVGSYRVALRAGWQAFWPEGQVVKVELCIPPASVGATWAGAVLVSLPGIDITTWHKRSPPKAPLGLMLTTLVSFMVTLVIGTVLVSNGTWATSLSAALNRGPVFDDVAALVDTADAWHVQVTVRHAHVVHDDKGDDYLCDVGSSWLLMQANDGPETIAGPSDAEVEAHLPDHCNIEERAAQLATMIRTLDQRRLHRDDAEPVPMSGGTLEDNLEFSENVQSLYRRIARDQCLETTRRALWDAAPALARTEFRKRLDHELNSNPANVCVQIGHGKPPNFEGRVVAVDDETGVLDSNLVWHRGSSEHRLLGLSLFVAGLVLTCGGAVWSYLRQLQFSAELEAWAKWARSETASRAASHEYR